MRSEATKNSPRLGLLRMFPVDEVALHIQHHITCSTTHGCHEFRDELDHTYMVQSLRDNGTAHQW